MYKGWIDLPLDDELLAKYYQGELKISDYVNLKENQYCMITHKDEPLSREIWKRKNGKLQKVNYQTIGSDLTSCVAKPRNPQQIMEFDLLNDSTTTIKLITGRWGTGKTWACATAALEQLKENKFDRIIYIRNNIKLKDTEPIGALPGDLWDKMVQWVGPFIDAAGNDTGTIKDMVEQEQLVIQPLESLRGRNFSNSIVFVDEAENLTVEQLQLIIARAAENTQIWMNGDTRQRDKATFENSKGIEAMREYLAGEKLFGYVHLIKTERSETAALADKLKPYVEEE